MDKPSVDNLRARLRELGYLEAGVDRFVVGPVGQAGGYLSLAWRSSVRIGLLAALLLGPSSAAMLGVWAPGLVTGARDGVVLALYLALLFGVAAALVAFLATIVLGSLSASGATRSSHARLLAHGAGALVTVVCLTYLVFWWRAVAPVWLTVMRWMVWWTVPVLVVAAAISLLLGHAVTVSSLALIARRSAVTDPSLRLRARSWTVRIGALALLFGAAMALLFFATRGDEARLRRNAVLMVLPPSVHVTVLALDGLDPQFVERIAPSGRTPRLARLLGGARADLPPSDAPDPARTWNSLATGQPAGVHGISGIETRRVSGLEGTVATPRSGLAAAIGVATDLVRLTRPVLTSGLQRRSKTFWEIAAELGIRTAVVNWWASWPAPPGPGIVLSDRASLRLERGGALDAEIAPSSLYPTLRQAWPALRDEARRRVLAAFANEDEAVAPTLRRAGEQDAVQVALAARVGAPASDLFAIYLPGLDIVQHELLGPGGGSGLPASALVVRVEALERYYAFLDQLIAPLVDAPDAARIVVLVGDPGRSSNRNGGVLAITGEAARPGARLSASRADLMPTLLYVLGIPTSRELPGRVLTALFTDSFTRSHSVRVIDSFGPRVVAPRPANATPLDQEMLDRLRSLGYVR